MKDVVICENTYIGPWVNLWGCTIREHCTIGGHCEIGKGVVVGARAKVEAYSFLPPGIFIEEDVFIGPGVRFCNDKYPPSGRRGPFEPETTIVEPWVSIGAGSVICPGITLGEGARIGAGSVVTKSMPPGGIWAGVPAGELRTRGGGVRDITWPPERNLD